jgi:hypothetical protein
MKKMEAAQLLLDGSEEAPPKVSWTFGQFMKVSRQEDGLFLPAQAAIALEVSNQRVLELIEVGRLRSWEFFGKRYVSCREVMQRVQSERLKGGRPKRTLGERVTSSAKILAGSDVAQVVSTALE